jgi:toxin-antitoxin system PIN domain toxin
VIVDANLLVYAVDEESPDHEAARRWLEAQLGGQTRVGLPWPSLLAFTRIVTLPRLVANPLEPGDAWNLVESWLAAETAWIPAPTAAHQQVLGGLIARHRIGGNLVPDAHLAALALEHGVEICSADSDFARFTEVSWRNPLR